MQNNIDIADKKIYELQSNNFALNEKLSEIPKPENAQETIQNLRIYEANVKVTI